MVRNLDHYYECRLEEPTNVAIHEREQRQLVAKCRQQLCHHWLSSRLALRVLKGCAAFLVKWNMWNNMKHVNLDKLMQNKMIIFHREAPFELRAKLIRAIILIDKLYCGIQVVICKL